MMIPVRTTFTRMGKVPLAAGKPGVRGCNGCGLGQGTYNPETGSWGDWSAGGGAVPNDGSWYESPLVTGLVRTGEQIATARYAVPQLTPGQTIQKTAGGTLLTQQAVGYPIASAITAQVSSGTWVLMAAAVIGLVAIMVMRKK